MSNAYSECNYGLSLINLRSKSMKSRTIHGIMLTEYFATNMGNKQEIENEAVDGSTRR
jgi:hypothetical protein